MKYEPVGALVNNSLEPLDYKLYNPKSVKFVDVTHKLGMRMYQQSLCFMLYKAVKEILPQGRLQIEHSMSNGFFCKITVPMSEEPEACGEADAHPQPDGESLPGACQTETARMIRERMLELEKKNLPFSTRLIPTEDAIRLFEEVGDETALNVLKGSSHIYSHIQFLDGIPIHLNGAMVPSTGYLKCWDFRTFEDGYLLQWPDSENPEKLSFYQETPKLFHIFQEHLKWVDLLQVPTIEALNRVVKEKGSNHLIQVSEALHEKKYAEIAEMINQRRGEVKMVLLAGPSSSGKTTSCRRLDVQLSVLGFDVQQMSLDDYFVSRDRTPKQPNGDYDFEALEALDIPLLNEHLNRLFKGERVEIPTYDFKKGESFYSGKSLQMGKDSILIVEGIHALNPKLTEDIPEELKFRVYVSALTQIAIDDQNLIHTSDNRLIRRIVRDNNFRGWDALETMKRWDSVQRGEQLHIFPFQENADVMFNSALLYELGVLRLYAEPQLKCVPQNCEEYAEAKRLLNFLEHVNMIDPRSIPPTSIMREFLGGSSFEY